MSSDWMYLLDEEHLVELIEVGRRFVSDDPDLRTVTAADYPLVRCQDALSAWAEAMDEGQGFVLVRGVPVADVGDEVAGAIFFIIGLHLGAPMGLNNRGDLIDHVYATSNLSYSDPNGLANEVRDRLPFHSDSADVVGLMCLQTARSGGESSLVSGPTLYNEVLSRRPDLVELLFEPWYFDLAKQNDDLAPFYDSPICCLVDGVLSTYFGPGIIRSAQRYDEVPKHTPAQLELLALIDEISQEPGIALDMDFRRGDIQLLLNYAALHSRTAFEDWPEPERRRHLLRFWLRRDNGRPLIERFGKHVLRDRAEVASAGLVGHFKIGDAVRRPTSAEE